MSEWNESTLRNAASWKAFKEGKALFENGAVTAAKRGGDGWSGTVKEGKRLFKVAVKVISPTNLEARCACPENQSTGAVCAHAVASALAALAGGKVSATATGSPAGSSDPRLDSPPPMAPLRSTAFTIGLPVNWQDMLKRGKLAAILSTGGELTPADERLSAWLAGAGLKPAASLPLNLDGAYCGSFLQAIAGHPRIEARKLNVRIEVQESGTLRMHSPEREGDHVRLEAADPLVQIGERWFRFSDAEIVPIGSPVTPLWLKQLLVMLGDGRAKSAVMRDFLNQIGQWQEWVEFPQTPWLDVLHFVPADPVFEMKIDGSFQKLEASVFVEYENDQPVLLGLGEPVRLPRLEGNRCIVRNWDKEIGVAKQLGEFGFESIDSISWSLVGEDAIVRFLSRHLPSLKQSWKIVGSDRFNQLKTQIKTISPKVEIMGSGDDWLRFNFSFQSNDGQSFSMADIRQLLRAKRSSNSGRVVIDDSASNIIEPLLSELEISQEDGGFIASKRAGEVIKELSKKIHNIHDSSNFCDSIESLKFPRIKALLRSYQTIGASWLVDRVSSYGGGLLADDMGLGKTIQAIACIDRLMEESGGIILVIATTSLLGNWQAEFGRFAPHLPVRLLHGSRREREQEASQPGDVLLTTYGTLPRDLAWYLKQKFRAIVLDEASLMRNPDTDHAKAISRLQADAKIALTGTPIENGVRDLWSIFRFIQPGWLGSREDFKRKYELFANDEKVMERLRLKVSPFMIRRTKEQVAPELPSKIYIEEFCELTSDQQAVYRELLNEGRKRVEEMEDTKNKGAARMRMLTVLLRLRQASCDLALFENDRFKSLQVAKRSAKLQRLLELVEEGVSGGHKILVFSQFQKQLREIEDCLSEVQISSLRLDGQTRNRQELVDNFQTKEGPPVFLISLKAGGYGLNLTAADIVIHFDPWWNPAAEAQATDRAHRIGQTRPVTVYRLIARGTVEEKVIALQNKKRSLASAIDDTGGGDASGWSEDDLKQLIEN